MELYVVKEIQAQFTLERRCFQMQNRILINTIIRNKYWAEADF